MLDEYKNKQLLFYNYFTNVMRTNKISHAYLIETCGVSYSFNLVLSLAKYFLCDGIYDEKICTQVDNNSFSDFYLIDNENIIKKEDILKLKNEFSFKSLSNNKKVYIIKNASLLNDSSANSLLKFLEEPESNVIAILIANSANDVMETIVSRCQVISLVNDETFNWYSIFDYFDRDEKDYNSLVNEELDKFSDFFYNLEKNKCFTLINRDFYEYTDHFSQLLKFGFYLYFELINDILKRDVKPFLPNNDNLKKFIISNNDYNSILKKVLLLNEYLNKAKYNFNKNLFFDNFVIKFGGC